MKITTVPFAVLGIQYKIARFPLQLIEDTVVVRMDAEAPARLFYERTLGMLDAAVGNALGDSQLEKRGAALAERSDALSRAAKLDAAATQKQQRAGDELKTKRDNAIKEQKQARDETEQDLRDARDKAEQRKSNAQRSAEQRTAAAKEQADAVAATRAKAVDEDKRAQQSRIRAKENTVTAAAQSKLEDARAKGEAAESKRAQADRLEQLADAEKANRRARRATGNR